MQVKYNLKYFLRQGIAHPEFFGDVIYKLRKILEHVHFDFLLQTRWYITQKRLCSSYDATHFTFGYRYLYSWKPCLSLRWCGDRQGLVLHDGVSLNLSPERYVHTFSLCHTINPSLTSSHSNCGLVIDYTSTVAKVVPLKRGLDCLKHFYFVFILNVLWCI